jgi:hypothetical protein
MRHDLLYLLATGTGDIRPFAMLLVAGIRHLAEGAQSVLGHHQASYQRLPAERIHFCQQSFRNGYG